MLSATTWLVLHLQGSLFSSSLLYLTFYTPTLNFRVSRTFINISNSNTTIEDKAIFQGYLKNLLFLSILIWKLVKFSADWIRTSCEASTGNEFVKNQKCICILFLIHRCLSVNSILIFKFTKIPDHESHLLNTVCTSRQVQRGIL